MTRTLEPIGRALRRARYRRLERRLAAPRLLAAFAEAYPRAFFVEVGSNDGEQHDHLRPFILASEWRGIMVEPVPYVFARLERNYGSLGRVALENAAITDRDGELPFFHLVDASPEERERLPGWYDGIGSFSRDAVLRHARHMPDIEERLVEARVEALTFSSLLARHGDPEVDLLVIDTEGHDARILATLDLVRTRPRLIAYEHFHLPRPEREACRARIEAAGYETLEEGFDTFCLDPADDSLTRAWRRLRPAVRGVSAEEEEAA